MKRFIRIMLYGIISILILGAVFGLFIYLACKFPASTIGIMVLILAFSIGIIIDESLKE